MGFLAMIRTSTLRVVLGNKLERIARSLLLVRLRSTAVPNDFEVMIPALLFSAIPSATTNTISG